MTTMAVSTDDFYAIVKRMRAYQKEYFRTRSKDALMHSKEWEGHVDDEINEYEAFNYVDL